MKGSKDNLKKEINHKLYIDGSWNQKKADLAIFRSTVELEFSWWAGGSSRLSFDSDVNKMLENYKRLFRRNKKMFCDGEVLYIVKTRGSLYKDFELFNYKITFCFKTNIELKSELNQKIEYFIDKMYVYSNI